MIIVSWRGVIAFGTCLLGFSNLRYTNLKIDMNYDQLLMTEHHKNFMTGPVLDKIEFWGIELF